MRDRWITDRQPSERFPGYTRANAGEVLADPVSPLGWTFLWEPGVVEACRDGFVTYGVTDYDEFRRVQPETYGSFGGYFYNCFSMTRLVGARMPGATPEDIDRAYFDDHPDVPPYVAEAWHESERHAAKLAETMGWALSATSFAELDWEKDLADDARAHRPDLSHLTDSMLVARARSLQPWLRPTFEHHVHASLAASIGPGVLASICEGLGRSGAHLHLIAGIGDIDSAAPSHALWALSRTVRADTGLSEAFDAGVAGLLDRLREDGSPVTTGFLEAFADFLARYGSRGPNEWDLRADVWETRPVLALAAIDRMRFASNEQAPAGRHRELVMERERLTSEIEVDLAGDPDTLALFHDALRSAHLFLAGRERGKTTMIKIIGEIRMVFLELGRRMVERGHLDHPKQVFMLLADEIDEFRFHPERFTAVLREREADYLALFELEPPFIVYGTVPPLTAWPRRAERGVDPVAEGTVLRGAASSGGVATGRARVLLDSADPGALEPGDVLIAPSTDPSWTPLFVPAAAVVVNVGALGSHAMIVSRELGIPCVASVADATLRIPDGAIVRVDGTVGTVTIVASPAPSRS